MSFVTTLILVFPGSEDEIERIKEVNEFKYRGLSLDIRSIDSPNKNPHEAWYGGTRFVNSNIYVGSYNHFEIKNFLKHLFSHVKWENPEYVQLFVKNENEWNFSLYINAGKAVAYKAIEQ